MNSAVSKFRTQDRSSSQFFLPGHLQLGPLLAVKGSDEFRFVDLLCLCVDPVDLYLLYVCNVDVCSFHVWCGKCAVSGVLLYVSLNAWSIYIVYMFTLCVCGACV